MHRKIKTILSAVQKWSATQDRRNRSDRGSITILVALGMTVFLGWCALVADIGLLYAQKAKLQNAVDAAALAGVQELPSDPQKAVQIAEDYALQNGVAAITTSIESHQLKMSVSAEKTVPTTFAKIWGITSEHIQAAAQAMMLPPTSLSGVVPLSIQEQDFEYGALYTLKSGSGNQSDDRYSGWYGALDLSSQGARSYETDLAYGYQGTLSIGQIVEIKHGNMSGPTQQGLEARLAQDQRVPRNTFADHDRDAPEIIYVPIVHVLDEPGNSVQRVEIVGFAAFFIEGVPGHGNDSVIQGRFLQALVPGSQTKWTLSDLLKEEQETNDGLTAVDYGLYTPKLVGQ